MIQGILLVIALSLDSFLAALAYAAKRIRIPFASAVVIASISACFLAFSFFLSAQIVQLIPVRAASLCAGGVFAFLSLYSFFQSSIKRLLRRNRRGICLHYGNIAVVLDIYLDEKKADRDNSKLLSIREAIYLAVALSFDSLFSGMALGFSVLRPLWIVGLDFMVALLSIYAGTIGGERFFHSRELELGWISGILFAILALTRFL